MFLCHFVLPIKSSIIPTFSISLLHDSFHLVCCLPLSLFAGTDASTILLSMCSSSLLFTCPYHLNLFSEIFFATGNTFTDALTCCSLMTLSLFVTPYSTYPHQHPHLIHLKPPLLAYRCCPCLCTVHQCWPKLCSVYLQLQLHGHLSISQHSTALLPIVHAALTRCLISMYINILKC